VGALTWINSYLADKSCHVSANAASWSAMILSSGTNGLLRVGEPGRSNASIGSTLSLMIKAKEQIDADDEGGRG
jgi:hypothetical protein